VGWTGGLGLRIDRLLNIGDQPQLLSKDFVALVLIACLIAIPLAYYLMGSWLQNYTYRVNLSWWIFAAAGLGALVVTLLTVSYQSIKAALINPVKSLRAE